MSKITTSRLERRGDKEILHVEAPGCTVNIHVGLHDSAGREVTRVSVDADGKDAGEDKGWFCPDLVALGVSSRGMGVRVVLMNSEPRACSISSDELDNVLQEVAAMAGWDETSQRVMALRFLSLAGQRGSDATLAEFRAFLEQQLTDEQDMGTNENE